MKRLIVPLLVLSAACSARTASVVPAAPPQPRPADAALAEQAKTELRHAWNGDKQYAWGQDDRLPVSKKGRNWYPRRHAAHDTGRHTVDDAHPLREIR
jgi:mannosidase alpha-like ER degradation enhancer 2